MQYDCVSTTVIFKKCPLCGEVWDSVESFLSDKSLRLNGFQHQYHIIRGLQSEKGIQSVRIPIQGFFIFTHHKTGCGTSMIVTAVSLKHINSKSMANTL